MSRLHHFLVAAALITILPAQTYALLNPFRRTRRTQSDAAKEAAERKKDLADFNNDVKKLVAITKELSSGKLTRREASEELADYHRKRGRLASDAAKLKITVPASVPQEVTVKHNGAQVDQLVAMLRKINTQIAAAKTEKALEKADQLFDKTEAVLKKKDRDAVRKVKKAKNTIIETQQERLETLIRQLKTINQQLKSKELTEEAAQPLENEFKALHTQAQTIKKKLSSSKRIPSMQKARTFGGKISERLDSRHQPLRKLISDLNDINSKLSDGGITETQAAQLQAEFAAKQKQAQGLKSQLRSSLKVPAIKEANIGPKRRLLGLRDASEKEKERFEAQKVRDKENITSKDREAAEKNLEAMIRRLKAINKQLESTKLTEEAAVSLENEFKALHTQAQTIKKKMSSSKRIPSMQTTRTFGGKISERLDSRHKPLRKLISDLNDINSKLSDGGITETQAAQLQAEFAAKQKEAQGLKSQLRSSLKIPAIKEANIGPKRRLLGLRDASEKEKERFEAQKVRDKENITSKDREAAEKNLEAMIRRLKAINKQLESTELTEEAAVPLENEFKELHAQAQSIKKKMSSNKRIPSMQTTRTLKGRISEKMDGRHKPLRKLISDLNDINSKLSDGGITETQAAQLQAEFAAKQKEAQDLKSQLRSSLKIPAIKEANIGPKRRMFGLRGASSTEKARFKAQEAEDKSESKKNKAKQTDKDMRAAEEDHEEMVRRHGANSNEAQAAKLRVDRLARDREETKNEADEAAQKEKDAQKKAKKKKKENSLKERLFGDDDDDDDDKKLGGGGMTGGGMGGGGGGMQQPMNQNMQQPYQQAPAAPPPAAPPAAVEENADNDDNDENDEEQDPVIDHAAQQRLNALEDRADRTANRNSQRAASVTHDGWDDAFAINDANDSSFFNDNDAHSSPLLDRLKGRADADTEEISSAATRAVASQQQAFGNSAFNYPGEY